MVAETPRAMTLDRPPGAATQGAGAVTLHGAAEWAAHGAEAAPPAKAVALLPCARRAGMSNVGWLVAALRFGELALEARDHLAEVANLGLEAGDLRTAGAGRRASGAVAGARPALARAKRPWAEAAGPATEPAAVRPTCGFASGSVVTRAVIAGALGAGMILALPGIAHAVHGRTIRRRTVSRRAGAEVTRSAASESRPAAPKAPAVRPSVVALSGVARLAFVALIAFVATVTFVATVASVAVVVRGSSGRGKQRQGRKPRRQQEGQEAAIHGVSPR